MNAVFRKLYKIKANINILPHSIRIIYKKIYKKICSFVFFIEKSFNTFDMHIHILALTYLSNYYYIQPCSPFSIINIIYLDPVVMQFDRDICREMDSMHKLNTKLHEKGFNIHW